MDLPLKRSSAVSIILFEASRRETTSACLASTDDSVSETVISQALPMTKIEVRMRAARLTARLPGILSPGIVFSCRFIMNQTPLRVVFSFSTQLSRVMSTLTMPRACSGPESYLLICNLVML